MLIRRARQYSSPDVTRRNSHATTPGVKMSSKILQLNFRFNVPRAEYEQVVSPLAIDFAQVPGLQWKIWLMNEAESEAGGIYLFDDESSLQAYLEGPLAGAVKAHPALSDLSAKVFDSIEELTAITRGPIGISGSV